MTLPHIICKNGERIISEIGNDTKIGYKYFLAGGVFDFSVKYRTCMGKPNGKIKVYLGENVACKIEIAPSEHWTEAKGTISAENGTYPLYIVYEGEGYIDIIDITFTK